MVIIITPEMLDVVLDNASTVAALIGEGGLVLIAD